VPSSRVSTGRTSSLRQIFLFLSLAVIGLGLYLKFFYDVPDSQAQINFFVSWFLIIVGSASLLINLVWNRSKRNPSRHD
jgi:hypothetical protein